MQPVYHLMNDLVEEQVEVSGWKLIPLCPKVCECCPLFNYKTEPAWWPG